MLTKVPLQRVGGVRQQKPSHRLLSRVELRRRIVVNRDEKRRNELLFTQSSHRETFARILRLEYFGLEDRRQGIRRTHPGQVSGGLLQSGISENALGVDLLQVVRVSLLGRPAHRDRLEGLGLFIPRGVKNPVEGRRGLSRQEQEIVVRGQGLLMSRGQIPRLRRRRNRCQLPRVHIQRVRNLQPDGQ